MTIRIGLEDLGKFLAAKGAKRLQNCSTCQDRECIMKLSRRSHGLQVHILSTGGTAAKLRDLGCTARCLVDLVSVSCRNSFHTDFGSRFKMLPTTQGPGPRDQLFGPRDVSFAKQHEQDLSGSLDDEVT